MSEAATHLRGKLADEPGRSPRRPRQPPRLSGRNRYSLFVGLMKLLLPAMAAALILLVIAWPQFTIDKDAFRLGLSRLAPRQAENLSMLNARFDGIDEKDQPFTITADMATQSDRNQELIDLELPKADISLDDGTWLALTARAGQYDRDSRQLDLIGSVSLFHDQGLEMRTESARIDLAGGTAEGSQPVQGHGTAGVIDAQGFRVFDRGERIVFTGRSHLTLFPAAKETLQ